MASSAYGTYRAGQPDFPLQRQQPAGVTNGVTANSRTHKHVASIAPEIAQLQCLNLDEGLKANVSHAENEREGLDSETGLKRTWLDVHFHITGAGLPGPQPFVNLEAIISPAAQATIPGGSQQNVDWVRLGVSKAVFVDQLVSPLAAWAWEGSKMALDVKRFNFGPEQGSMVWFDALLGGDEACAVDHFRKTTGGEGPPQDLQCVLQQVSEGGRAAVRADVRLRVSLSSLPRLFQHGCNGSSSNGSAKAAASLEMIAAPGSYRPIFTVTALCINELAPPKLKEPAFSPGPLLHGNIECAKIADAGQQRQPKPVGFGTHVPKSAARVTFGSDSATIAARLEPPPVKRAVHDRSFR